MHRSIWNNPPGQPLGILCLSFSQEWGIWPLRTRGWGKRLYPVPPPPPPAPWMLMFPIDQRIIRMCSFHFCSQKAAICYFGGCCGWVGATCKPSIVLCSQITELIPDHRLTVTSCCKYQFSNFTSRIITSLKSISVLLQSCTFLKKDRLQRQH